MKMEAKPTSMWCCHMVTSHWYWVATSARSSLCTQDNCLEEQLQDMGVGVGLGCFCSFCLFFPLALCQTYATRQRWKSKNPDPAFAFDDWNGKLISLIFYLDLKSWHFYKGTANRVCSRQPCQPLQCHIVSLPHSGGSGNPTSDRSQGYKLPLRSVFCSRNVIGVPSCPTLPKCFTGHINT